MSEEGIPYIGFDNEQLEKAEKIQEGDFAACPKCKMLVKIRNSEPPTTQFVSHCGNNWLVGINGKYVQNIKPAYSGEIDLGEKKEYFEI